MDLTVSPVQPTFWQAFRFWLRLGFISFGGPAGQIALMHQELVETRRWISQGRFLHALNYCMVLPGPEAQQLATYIGWLLHKTWGGIIAGVLFVLPSLFILIVISWLYIALGDQPIVSGIFYGIKPAVTAIVLHAAYRIGLRTLCNKILWAIAGTSFLVIFVFNLPFPIIVIAAAFIGYVGGQKASGYFSVKSNNNIVESSHHNAVIDDETPRLKHTQFCFRSLYLTLGIGVLLWCIPILILISVFGWQHTLTQMAWFFTKAALLTFGGAYAVLPYVFQGAVNSYGWISPGQMIDGLALGETTPGPLIMVVAFIGFVGGYLKAFFGPDLLFVAGMLAAVLVTWFTFLPSVLFILIGGPLVESTHRDLRFTAPLTAITAAVVGVILNLALFFASNVFWPKGFAGHLDWYAVLLSILCSVALFRFRVNIIYLISVSALAGLALQIIRSL